MTRIVWLISLLLTTSCGGQFTSGESAPPVDHAKVLADHETTDLAARLVVVPGYSYRDPRDADVELSLKALHRIEDEADHEGLFAAASHHAVVADDSSLNVTKAGDGSNEVGYLVLVQFDLELPTSREDREAMLEAEFGASAIVHRIVSGVDVSVFENPSSPQSRYFVMWIDDGVQGQFDGAELEPLLTWLNAYLAVAHSLDR